MKEKGISAAGGGRLGRLLKDVWFVVLTKGVAPTPGELRVMCDLNGISYAEAYRIFASFAEWNGKEDGNE